MGEVPDSVIVSYCVEGYRFFYSRIVRGLRDGAWDKVRIPANEDCPLVKLLEYSSSTKES